MNNLFALASNETTAGSVYFLNSIFGTVGNVLGGTGPQLLGSMFQVFNTAVLAVGSLMVTYTTVVSILLTAHEGEALGKKFHSLWIPMRTVMGIAALVPTASGYSYMQIALMWFIIQGVGAADTLWATTVNYVASGQSTVPNPPGTARATLRLGLGQLWQGLSCQAAAKANYSSGYYCADNPTTPFCTNTDTLSIAAGSSGVKNGYYEMGPSGACGRLKLGDATSLGQAKNQAFSQIITTLGSLASQMVALDYGYGQFINTVVTPPNPPPTPPSWLAAYCTDNNISGAQCLPSIFSTAFPQPSATVKAESTVKDIYWQYGLEAVAGGNFIQTAGNLYTGIVGAAMGTSGAGSNNLASVQTTAINNGWIYAGGYFYYLAKANNAISLNVGTIDVEPPASKMTLDTEKAMASAAGTLAQYINATMSPSSGSTSGLSTTCGGSEYSGSANFLCDEILGSWIANLSGSSTGALSQNPVLAAQSEGHTILTAVMIVIPIIFFTNIGFGLLGGIYLGTSPGVAAAIATVNSIIPIAMFIILVFLGLGLTLAVYTPMIPYMLFTFGAINWLIASIETMIAAPIVAIGLLHPEGHEVWGQAEKAMMLILNIFLRPSLMIFGMIGGMLMTYTVVMMINYAFLNVVTMVSGNSANLIEMIFFMVLYTSIFTTSMNKCFDLIHMVPDKIMRWIGGGSEQFGEAGGLDKVGQSMEAGGGKASEFAKGAGETAGKGAGEYGQARTKDKAGKGARNASETPPGNPPGGSPPAGGAPPAGGGEAVG